MASTPPPPPGFVLDGPPQKKASAPPRKASAPPPPPGFRLDQPDGYARDGDTFRLTNGSNARLYGVDAFELPQTGTIDGQRVPLGIQARDALRARLTPKSVVGDTGTRSYNRPVVTLTNNGNDAGRGMISTGLALPVPAYLAADPKRRDAYLKTQRDAIAAERGAYAGQYQLPSDYRAKGSKAKMRGKILMTPQQAKEYAALVRNPQTLPEQLSAWIEAQGHSAANVGNILSFMRRNPNAQVSTYFQQQDVLDQPVLPDGPHVVTRSLGALNEGIADLLGGPVDLVNAGLGAAGVPVSNKPFLGSDFIREGMHGLGIGQTSEAFAPRSNAERYGQAMARGVGQAAIPMGGMIGAGGRLALSSAPVLNASPARMAVRNALTDAARRPGVVVAGELGGGIGANVGGQVADDVAPGNPYAQMAGQVIGGLAGGLGAGIPASRRAAPDIVVQAPREDVPPPPPGYVMDMANESPTPSHSGPRQPDVIDIANRPHPVLADATEAQRYAQSQRIEPGDVLPLPGNAVQSVEEAASIGAGMRPAVRAPNEAVELASRNITSAKGNQIPKRGPVDLVTFLRMRGGIRPQGGELTAMGIDNAPRNLDFARGEQRFGHLVNDDAGLTYEEAAQLAWDEGYFPDLPERPIINEFLDALEATHSGRNRSFLGSDLEEIDRFYSAQGQRYAVEQAAQEGAPLVEDRGQPVTLEDMQANTPPVSAYEEWGPSGAPDFAGNIRLEKLDTPQDIKRVLAITDQWVGGFDAARRGRITQAETQSLANELGMTADDLLKRRKGQAFNAEEALAAREILAKSGNELVNLARRVRALDEPGDELLSEFRKAWVRHVAIQEQVAGATAEAGRALGQFRMPANSRNVRRDVLAGLVGGAGGTQRLKDAADIILDADPAQVNQAARLAMKPKLSDKLVELWYNWLLSGPQTHVVNTVSNTLTSLGQIPEHAVAAGIGGARSLAARRNIADRVLFTELGARATGLMQGTKEGLMQAARTFRTGEPSDFVTKVEAQAQKAISGKKGELIRIPTRALSAEDELFKAMARRMELTGLAVRQVKAEGLKGAEAKAKAAELVANPTDEMLEKAFDYGRYLTFQRPLGPVGRHISAMTQNAPYLKLILPFVRTPTNLLKFSLERSPAAPLLREWRADVKAGGARRDLALARAAVGSGIGALVTQWAADGNITGGGPADDGAKALLRADGWQPYSIRIGDKYYSYQRLDPFASTLGVAADMVDLQDHMTDKQKEKVALLVTASVLQNLSSKTWLSGIGDLTAAVNDPARYADGFIKRLAGSIAVPAGVAQVARTVDPTLREAEGVVDQVRSRIPVVSKRLPPKRDVWGRPITAEGGFGPNIVSPIWQSTRRNDPINNALLGAGAHIGKPKRDVGGRRLTAQEYGVYQQRTGTIARQELLPLVSSPEWPSLTPDEQQDAVAEIMRGARKAAREELFGSASRVPAPPQGFRSNPPPAGYVLDHR